MVTGDTILGGLQIGDSSPLRDEGKTFESSLKTSHFEPYLTCKHVDACTFFWVKQRVQ